MKSANGSTNLQGIESTRNISKKMFSVFDEKANAFLDPFFAKTEGMAIRMFEQTLQDPQCPFAQFPGDFTLFMIGTWDEFTGKPEPLEHGTVSSLGTALQYMPRSPIAGDNGMEVEV